MNTLKELQGEVLHQIRVTYGTSAACVSLVNRLKNTMDHLVLSPMSDGPETFSTPINPLTCCARVIKTQETLVIGHYSKRTIDLHCPFLEAEQLEAYLGARLMLHGYCVGVLETMAPAPRPWSDSDVAQISDFAGIMETLLEEAAPVKAKASETRHLN